MLSKTSARTALPSSLGLSDWREKGCGKFICFMSGIKYFISLVSGNYEKRFGKFSMKTWLKAPIKLKDNNRSRRKTFTFPFWDFHYSIALLPGAVEHPAYFLAPAPPVLQLPASTSQ